ncbi:hypothetical protein M885DRAFT_503028 [Pelagophyceae sp. CCMP2097]|nr:hypothetical protein M885DRAFT_503028 [Pelagophyceae sp. CCMP2097]
MTEVNRADEAISRAGLDANAFVSFKNDARATSHANHRYVAKARDTRVIRAHGGQRRNLARWAGTLLAAVYGDDIEMLEDALSAPLARPDVVVAWSGAGGASLSFGGDAIVSREMVAKQTGSLVAQTKATAYALRRHYVDAEWRNIELHLASILDTAPSAATFDRADVGDTALHLAVRHGADRVARRLLLRGYDPLRVNESGDTAVELLEERLAGAPARRAPVARGAAGAAARRAQHALHALTCALCDVLSERDAAVEPLAEAAWRAALEGGALSGTDAGRLAARPALRDALDRCGKARSDTASKALSVRALLRSRRASSGKDSNELRLYRACARLRAHAAQRATQPACDDASLQEESFISFPASLSTESLLGSLASSTVRQIDVPQWLDDLDDCAALIQAVWRGYATRCDLLEAVRQICAARLQATFRAKLVRMRLGLDARRKREAAPEGPPA